LGLSPLFGVTPPLYRGGIRRGEGVYPPYTPIEGDRRTLLHIRQEGRCIIPPLHLMSSDEVMSKQ